MGSCMQCLHHSSEPPVVMLGCGMRASPADNQLVVLATLLHFSSAFKDCRFCWSCYVCVLNNQLAVTVWLRCTQ